jgi:hypothetical protein
MVSATSRAPASNLPAAVTTFVGRRQEIGEGKRLLSVSRLVTLTCVGGVGKTRLALRIAADSRRAFPDGVYLVELAELKDPALLAHTVAERLGLRDQSARWAVTTLSEHLADKHLLLVLDNCEHLVDACPELTDTLLRSCPLLRVLATSRQLQGIFGEATLTVPPLSVPEPGLAHTPQTLFQYDAATLFADRAMSVLPGLVIDGRTCGTIARLCQRLEGIPLAIARQFSTWSRRSWTSPSCCGRSTTARSATGCWRPSASTVRRSSRRSARLGCTGVGTGICTTGWPKSSRPSGSVPTRSGGSRGCGVSTRISGWPWTTASPSRARQESGHRIAAHLERYWVARGLHKEGRHWLDQVLEAAPEPTVSRAKALRVDVWLATLQGDVDRVEAALRECREIAEKLGDPLTLAYVPQVAGMAAQFEGDMAQAITLLEEALAGFRGGLPHRRGLRPVGPRHRSGLLG